MPYPQNLETAKEVQAIVRKNGAVLATIAILDGTPYIGFYTLERLAQLGKSAQKTVRRDIAHETQGVCAPAYKTYEFPAFFTEPSGHKMQTGNLISEMEYDFSSHSKRTLSFKKLNRGKDITGNAETSFLLARVSELTGGASLASNIALVKNNAVLCAKLSVALAQLK